MRIEFRNGLQIGFINKLLEDIVKYANRDRISIDDHVAESSVGVRGYRKVAFDSSARATNLITSRRMSGI